MKIAEPVCNKRDMQRRLAAGEFGNTTRLWPTITASVDEIDIKPMPLPNYVALRSYERGAICHPMLRLDDVVAFWMTEPHSIINAYYVQEVADPKHLKVAGELMRDEFGLCLRFTRVKKLMRDAFLVEDKTARNLRATAVLEYYAEPEDIEHLMHLLDTYPDHVVEFSCFDITLGVEQRKMIVWEVRRY